MSIPVALNHAGPVALNHAGATTLSQRYAKEATLTQSRAIIVCFSTSTKLATNLTKMHGELAQIIALAAHGSVWLAGPPSEPLPQLETANSTFQYVRRIRFQLRDSSQDASSTASDVADWLKGARTREVERFWLFTPAPRDTNVERQEVPDRMLAAFAGAGRWFLLGTLSGRSEVWRAAWVVGERNAPDRRIWNVEYEGQSRQNIIEPPRPEISSATRRLVAALGKVEQFAHSHELEDWARKFANIRQVADREDVEPPYHPDMLPARGFAEPAGRLLTLAARSWVFGGMGSWNDLVFRNESDEGEYSEVSDELYSAVLTAFVAAVNAELAL